MYKIAICDDESVYAKRLERIITHYSSSNFLVQIQCYTSSICLLNNLCEEFDICFLDIEIPEVNGIELAKRIKKYKQSTKIIFVTSHEERALETYDIQGCGFLLKHTIEDKISEFLDKLFETIENEKTLIKTKEGVIKIENQEIQYINIEGRNICYHLRDGGALIGPALRGTFRDAVSQFFNKPDFFFLQPSLIVNLDNIRLLNREHIQFKDGEIYYLPKNGYNKIMQVWSYYKVER